MRTIQSIKIIAVISILMLQIHDLSGQEKSKDFLQGREFFMSKEYDRALKSFQKEYKKNPSVEVKFWIAHTYAEMNETSKAKALFLEIVESNYSGSEKGLALCNLGVCYAESKQNDSAYFYFDKTIKDFPQFASGYLNKGQMLYSEGKFEEAKELLDKAIEKDSTNWWAYQKRLEVCFGAQNYECALKDLLNVKRLNPKVDNQMNLAYCYSMLKRYAEADSIFQTVYDEKDALFLNNYGMNKHNMGQTVEGKRIIMKSIELKPENSYAYRNLALIAIDEKDNTKICEYLEKAKSLGFEKFYGKEVNELLIKHCK